MYCNKMLLDSLSTGMKIPRVLQPHPPQPQLSCPKDRRGKIPWPSSLASGLKILWPGKLAPHPIRDLKNSDQKDTLSFLIEFPIAQSLEL